VLVVQNTVAQRDIGSGSALVAFFRSLGGAIGVSALGALLAAHASSSIVSGMAERGIDLSQLGGSADQVPNVNTLPGPIAHVVEHAYGTGVAEMFLLAAPLGVVTFVALLFMREKPLGSKSGIERILEEEPS
jgi:cation transporter-like permease